MNIEPIDILYFILALPLIIVFGYAIIAGAFVKFVGTYEVITRMAPLAIKSEMESRKEKKEQ